MGICFRMVFYFHTCYIFYRLASLLFLSVQQAGRESNLRLAVYKHAELLNNLLSQQLLATDPAYKAVHVYQPSFCNTWVLFQEVKRSTRSRTGTQSIFRWWYARICLGDLNPWTMYLCIRKDALSDVLNLPVLRFHRFRSDVVSLILILRLHFLSYTIELVQTLLFVLLLLLLFVHAITSGIVCARAIDICIKSSYWDDLTFIVQLFIEIFSFLVRKPPLEVFTFIFILFYYQ